MVSSTTGKIDGMLFLGGALGGMLVFGLAYPLVAPLMTMGEIAGSPTVPGVLGVRPGLIALGMTVMAVVGFIGAEWAERRFGDGPVQP